MGDDDLIRRGDAARAVALCSAESDSPNAHFVCRQAVNAIRAIPAADARAEALKGAEKALRDWQDSLNVHRMTETAITVGMAADVVAALIADVPRE